MKRKIIIINLFALSLILASKPLFGAAPAHQALPGSASKAPASLASLAAQQKAAVDGKSAQENRAKPKTIFFSKAFTISSQGTICEITASKDDGKKFVKQIITYSDSDHANFAVKINGVQIKTSPIKNVELSVSTNLADQEKSDLLASLLLVRERMLVATIQAFGVSELGYSIVSGTYEVNTTIE